MKNRKAILVLLYSSLIPVCFTIFFPIKTTALKNFKDKPFRLENTIFPSGNSNIKTTYSTVIIGNLSYATPDAATYIWVTGDGDLPCLNTKQLDYLKKKLGYIPQQRTANLKDGFYSMPFVIVK